MRTDDVLRRGFLGGVAAGLFSLSGCFAETGELTPGRNETASPNESTTSAPGTPQPTASRTETPATATETASDPAVEGPPWWQPRGSVLDSFETFDADWTIGGGTATVTMDQVFNGGPSILLDSAGDKRFRIERRYPTPQDLSNLEFSMAVRLEETTKGLVQVEFMLIDSSGNKRTLSGSIMPAATDRWVRFDLGVRQDEGADMTAIETLRIAHWTGNDETKLYVDDIRVHPKPETGYVMFTFDDKGLTDYTVAFPTLQEYGYVGTCFPPIQRVTSDSTPSIAEYQEMRERGWDIGGHTLDHEDLTNHSRTEQQAIIEENYRQLHEKGLAGDVNHFRTPYSNYDTNSLDLMTESFDTAMIGSGSATGTNVHVTDHRTIGFRSGDELESAIRDIAAAAEYRQLLGMTLHMGAIDGDHLRTLAEHVRRHEREGRLRVITPSQLYDDFILP